jgi:hypothetical protein
MTDTPDKTAEALAATYDCPISGEPKRERRKHPRAHCTREMEQLFNGFHNLIDNLKDRDTYLCGYTKAMRDSLAELLRSLAAQPQAEPVAAEGFVLMPVKLTPEIRAVFERCESERDLTIEEAWEAMLAARPPVAQQGAAEAVADLVNDSWANDWLTNRAELHPLTVNLVVRFARALAAKLAAAEKKYGYSDGWRSPDWMDECRQKLMEHIEKGDPRDVAAYCAFLWHHGESTRGDSRG